MSDYSSSRRRVVNDNEFTLATQVAAIVISRALRPLRKHLRSFVAGLVLNKETDRGAYRTAAIRILDLPKQDEWDEQGCTRSFDVFCVDAPDDLASQLGKLKYCHRAIVLLASKELTTANVQAACDTVLELPLPTAEDFMIGLRSMGFGRVTRVDAEFLATQEIDRVSLAFRHGRDVSEVVARLRDLAERDKASLPATERAGPSLDELSGYGEAKTWGLELAKDLSDWKEGRLEWESVDRGILVSGPPGSGKTQFAAALANSCGVALVATSAAQWQSCGHLGDMLKAMRRSFEEARKKSPSILFIDEFDSIGDRSLASGENASYQRQVVNALLECIDGTEALNGVVVVGATNYPGLIDPALLRPGRLERQVVIGMPDKSARTDIFRYHLGKDLQDVDIADLVEHSVGWSGADIARCIRVARRSARRARRALDIKDLVSAMPERVTVSHEDLKRVAVHEAGHALAGVLVDSGELVSVSISETILTASDVQGLGGTVFAERSLVSKTSIYFDDRIAVLLAGMAAERIVFGNHTTGSGGHSDSDLVRATELATMMEVKWGFGSTISSRAADRQGDLESLRETRPMLAMDVEARLQAQYARAEKMLTENSDVLDKVIEVLVERKTLSGGEVRQMVRQARMENHELAVVPAARVYN